MQEMKVPIPRPITVQERSIVVVFDNRDRSLRILKNRHQEISFPLLLDEVAELASSFQRTEARAYQRVRIH